MPLRPALLAAALLTGLSACNSADDAPAPDAAATPGDQSLAALLRADGNLSSAAQALSAAGLEQALDAQASYTVLAPNNAAFATFDEAAGGQTSEAADRNAALAAVMRGHILPGYLTGQDIRAALAARSEGVTMETMAGEPLTFSRDGEMIRVTAADGSTAVLLGDGAGGSNGVVLPIDAVLKKL